MSRLPVVVPVHNNVPMAMEAIARFHTHTGPNIRFVLVDNASDLPLDPIAAMLAPHDVPVEIIRNEENLGVYKALNQGLARSEDDLVAILCTDVYVLPFWAHPCMLILQQAQDVVWASVEERQGPYQLHYGYAAQQAGVLPQYETAQEFHSSVAIVNWKRITQEVGWFDESFFLTFGDTDLCERLNLAGLKAAWVKGAYCQHLGSQSRRLTGVATDTERDIKDAMRFVEKWKDRPDVLARHEGVELYLPEHAAQIRAQKAARWETP